MAKTDIPGIKPQDILGSSSVDDKLVITTIDSHRIYSEPGREPLYRKDITAPLMRNGDFNEDEVLRWHHQFVKDLHAGNVKLPKPTAKGEAKSLKEELADVGSDDVA